MINAGAEKSPKIKTVFRTIGLTKTYEMGEVKVHALRGIDSELYPGELVVLLGASGSGKSTYMNILGGLDRASSGQVFYRDQDLTHATEAELTEYRRYHVGFVFQFYNLIPSLTALENVSIVTEIANNPMKPEDALELVNLGNRMNHFPSELSGGEQQRVSIARAIAKNPAVLLCDEPTGALDSETGVLVLSAIEQINRELNTTTAVITHNISIGAMADRVIRLSDGLISNIDINQHKVSPRDIRW
jgi:putative ABC transport system ATP-binding protein